MHLQAYIDPIVSYLGRGSGSDHVPRCLQLLRLSAYREAVEVPRWLQY